MSNSSFKTSNIFFYVYLPKQRLGSASSNCISCFPSHVTMSDDHDHDHEGQEKLSPIPLNTCKYSYTQGTDWLSYPLIDYYMDNQLQ